MALTATDLRRIARRLDRRLGSANAALAAMRRGQTLHLQYRAGRRLWTLSDGRPVTAEVAATEQNADMQHRRAFRGGGTEGSA